MKINENESFSEGWKRTVKDECESVLNYAEGPYENRHEAVHEIRKSLKKIRAALRLVRFQLEDYKKENQFFRDLGRNVSKIRDATSVIEALDRLQNQFDSDLYQNTFQTFLKKLLDYRQQLETYYFEEQQMLQTIALELRTKLPEIESWEIPISGFHSIRKGLKKVYKRGYKAFHASAQNPTTEQLHELRKRAKYLRYQLDLLNPVWPRVFSAIENELHLLTDYLGMDRDLATLEQLIEKNSIEFFDIPSKDLFLSMLKKERLKLQQQALNQGQKLYVDKPSDFCAHVEACWLSYDGFEKGEEPVGEVSIDLEN